MIYLDAASTAKRENIDNVIIETMTDAMRKYWMNPSSLYATHVKEEIDRCRSNIAKFINAEPSEIYFTSGASESNNWAIRGWADEIWLKTFKTPCVVSTHIEHKSILKLFEDGNLDAVVKYCSVDEFGIVDLKSLERQLREPVLVSIHMANNEIGSIQPIKEISDLVHKHGGTLHVDATQALGHIPIDVKELGIDMMSASGHKISPVLKGIGFLYKKKCINIHPLIYGAQENGLRGGTENTFGIIGLSKAIDCCDIGYEKFEDISNKRDYFIESLESKYGCKLNGHREHRLPNNINVTFPQNITGESLLYTLDLSDIKVSVSSACNSKFIVPSHVLKGIGLSDDQAMRTVRFTLPDYIAYEDIDYAIKEIGKSIKLIETN